MTEGIHYWKTTIRKDCPKMCNPVTYTDYTNDTPHESEQTPTATRFDIQVDALYAGDSSHRKSVTGFVVQMAGGSVLYETKFQDVIALSFTEAEYIAACDAGNK